MGLLMSTFDAGRLVRFGAFELDLDEGVLHRYGRRVPLQEQPARILTLLVSRPGEVVTREELGTSCGRTTPSSNSTRA